MRAPAPVIACSIVFVACAEPMSPAQAPPRTSSVRIVEDETVGCTATPPVRTPPAEFDDTDASAVRLFYDVLAPYGTWRDDSRLGLVWTPTAEGLDGFVPYATHGRWTYRAFPLASGDVADDWTWVSDLPWGWVAFHYGRWTYAGRDGWAWIPGRRYAGAWVDWRVPDEGEAIVGWGPTPPSHLWRVSSRGGRAFVDAASFDPRDALYDTVAYAAFATPYTYVQARDVFAPDLGSRLLHGPAAFAVAHMTRPAGPPRPARLGIAANEVPAPPALDRGLQQAWMLATPASAAAVGAGDELASPPHLRTWVAGGRRVR